MYEFVVKVPDEFMPAVRFLGEEGIQSLVAEALRERTSEQLMFRLADELLKKI